MTLAFEVLAAIHHEQSRAASRMRRRAMGAAGMRLGMKS